MLLTIDVGNTNIFFGLFKGEKLIDTFRLTSKTDRTIDEMGLVLLELLRTDAIEARDIDGIVLSSVVPHLSKVLLGTFAKYFAAAEVIEVGPGIKTGISIQTENPKEVGADRIVNVAAAHELYQRSTIIIDFGTATTFDYVDKKGIFKYTVIMPGLKLAAEALFTGTAKLPDIEVNIPDSVLASNTVAGMQAGIVYGYIGAVKYTVGQQIKELNDEPLIVATGGIDRDFIERVSEIKIFEPNLALEGMKIIYKKNKKIKGDLKN